MYTIRNIPSGSYTIVARFVGYITRSSEVNVSGSTTVDFELEPQVIEMKALTVLAEQAKPRETPVAFTEVTQEEIQERLGSRDLPMVLNGSPGVYASMQGGGTGDSRINVRGFNQRNVAVMINGMPVNDMENGWVYWSNWDGLADVTSQIQVQRVPRRLEPRHWPLSVVRSTLSPPPPMRSRVSR